MKRLLITCLTIFLLAASLPCFALQTQPLPKNLIALSSSAGIKLFESSEHQAFWKLMPYFVTQKNLAFCGVASSVMALNGLDFPAPVDPAHAPYRMYTQTNFFTPDVNKIVNADYVSHHGLTLDQLTNILKLYIPHVEEIHGSNISLHAFTEAVISSVVSTDQFILVNFCRANIGEQGCGHFSPIAAYDAKSDRFLILDVARYKYPPVWVKAADLYAAIKTIDSASKKSRGYIVVSKW